MVILLGADEGDPVAALARAEELVRQRVGRIRSRSRPHWTKAWGFASDALFLNRALLIDTGDRAPADVLALLLGIEQDLGRVRDPGQRYASRTIDIDILFVQEERIDRPGLQVPHPRVHQRYFALAPAADIVPGLRHPQLGRTVLQLLNDVMRNGDHG